MIDSAATTEFLVLSFFLDADFLGGGIYDLRPFDALRLLRAASPFTIYYWELRCEVIISLSKMKAGVEFIYRSQNGEGAL